MVAARAKEICRGYGPDTVCPIILECLFYGLVTGDDFGVWGGLSTRERNALRRTKTLDKYRAVSHLRGTKYWALIHHYLETSNASEETEEGHQPEAEGVPGGEEA